METVYNAAYKSRTKFCSVNEH